jgi:hypothetical protein
MRFCPSDLLIGIREPLEFLLSKYIIGAHLSFLDALLLFSEDVDIQSFQMWRIDHQLYVS